jgi:hypothetical protein
MKRYPYLLILLLFTLVSCKKEKEQVRKLCISEYQDKMKGAWVGQMAGVGWGLPTEFKFPDEIIPLDKVPEWDPEMINQHGNDDLYVEMTFIASMDNHWYDVSIRQAGIDFANTGYGLWAANKRGRDNIRSGIPPPESSHPQYSDNCDDIDYQIEADFSGILVPGMPNLAIEMGEKFGRLMNYGDGLYGGQFVGGMYTEAYFESDIEKVIQAGLACIPAESNYAQCVRDVMTWHKEYPDDWTKTWQLIEDKYRHSLEYQGFAAQRENVWIPIDAKLNGAYIVLGLLYGNSDMDSTIVISMRAGKDSDCNPSNAAGVLGTIIGFENLPEKYKTALDYSRKFSYSDYDLNKLMEVCEELSRVLIVDHGGELISDEELGQCWLIPVQKPVPSPFQPSYDPGPFDPDNMFSEEELSQLQAYGSRNFKFLTEKMEIPWEIEYCGRGITPAEITWNGKSNVFTTTPMSNERSVKLGYRGEPLIPEGEKGYLEFFAGNESDASWNLKVIVNYKGVLDTVIESGSGPAWHPFKVPIEGTLPGGTLDIALFASNVDGNPAVNYWADFKMVKGE